MDSFKRVACGGWTQESGSRHSTSDRYQMASRSLQPLGGKQLLQFVTGRATDAEGALVGSLASFQVHDSARRAFRASASPPGRASR